MSSLNKAKNKEVSFKNYIYLFLILLGSVLFLLYIYTWYETYNINKLNISVMNDYLTVINYNELEDYIIENKNAVIYVSVLGDKNINKFENKFKNIILDNNLKNDILYLDLTNENLNLAKKKLKIEDDFPYLIIYTNGKITDTYNISKNNYNPSKTLKYLNRIGVCESD